MFLKLENAENSKKSDSSSLAHGHHIQAIFPAEIFQDLYNKVIYNPSLIIIYSTWGEETLRDTALFLPPIVPTARVAVGIILPLVFISSNFPIRVASLLEGRFCFRWRSILTFSPTCLEIGEIFVRYLHIRTDLHAWLF